MRRTFDCALLAVALLMVVFAISPGGTTVDGWTLVDASGDQVRIYRDEFGVPHIFAETSRGLYEAYGYVVAEDRLWQMEVNRRTARGRLAEVLGSGSVAAGPECPIGHGGLQYHCESRRRWRRTGRASLFEEGSVPLFNRRDDCETDEQLVSKTTRGVGEGTSYRIG